MTMNSHFVGDNFRFDLDRRKAEQRAFHGNSKSDFARYPLLYIGLLISGGLSALSGIFIGLAPHYVDGILVVNLDFINIMFAVLYAVTFPMLGEYAIAEWHKKYSLRDMDDVSDDRRQAIIALVMLFISVAFTLITSLAASVILISLLGSFDVFRHIPAWAQTWTAIVIPIGAVLHSVATIAYKHNSREEENLRLLRRQRMDAETQARLIIEQARTQAEIDVNVHRAQQFAEMAKQRAPQFGSELARRDIQRHFGGAGYPAQQSPRQVMASETVAVKPNPTGEPEQEDQLRQRHQPPKPD
jgi:hypothetical protein